ncbi:MAG TPA: hypothetical protein VIY48_21815 [Candidatus Paceibacterota bacterium]
MNLTEIRTRLRRAIGNPSAASIPDATLDLFINAAYTDIVEKNKFHKARKLCRFDSVTDQDKYTLPSDVYAIIHVRDRTNEQRLIKRDAQQIFEVFGSATTGLPRYYAHLRGWIQIFPTPNGVYSIEVLYRSSLTALSDTNPTPEIPASWHEAIPLLARHKYYDDTGDVSKSLYALNLYKDWIKDKPVEVNQELRDLDSGVRIPSLERNYPRRSAWDAEDDV